MLGWLRKRIYSICHVLRVAALLNQVSIPTILAIFLFRYVPFGIVITLFVSNLSDVFKFFVQREKRLLKLRFGFGNMSSDLNTLRLWNCIVVEKSSSCKL